MNNNNNYNNSDDKKVDFLVKFRKKVRCYPEFMILGDYFSYLRFKGTKFENNNFTLIFYQNNFLLANLEVVRPARRGGGLRRAGRWHQI